MDPRTHDVLVQSIIEDEISEESRIEAAALAALLTLVKNQQESDGSEDYDSEYESLEEGYEYQDEGEEVSEPKQPLNPLSALRKRGRGELRDEPSRPLPKEVSQPQPRKRARIGSPSALAQSNDRIDPPKPAMKRETRQFYSPDQVIRMINPKTPGAYSIAKAVADIKLRFKDQASERELAIVATRLWSDPHGPDMYHAMSDRIKEMFFWKWAEEVTGKPRASIVPKEISAPVPQERKDLGNASTSAPKREMVQVRLKADVLKQVDARSQGKLEERVRMWLDNVTPN